MYRPSPKVPQFINPPNLLKQKVGGGGISPELIIKSQTFIENNQVDFTPEAIKFLDEINKAIKTAEGSKKKTSKLKQAIVNPVMQLKANGGMFGYQLVSDIADIALQFLERIDALDDDAIKVIIAHRETLDIIISSGLTGDGQEAGYALVKELHRACKRYFKKHPAT